ncbi:MAG: hypothetical protein Q7U04_00900 [Bacteriovorax sp.]|nr:hypothetical protein [Bacteriovorax sp.]
MKDIIELFLSPIGLSSFVTLALAPLVVAYPIVWRKRTKRITDYFNGQFSFFSSELRFDFSSHQFHLSRIARGGGAVGMGGSFPVLWVYAQKNSKFFIGHVDSCKYCYVGDLPKKHQLITINNSQILLGNDSEELNAKMLQRLLETSDEIKECIHNLFPNKFCHIKLRRELHIGGKFFISKKYVLRYYGINEVIYQEPKVLELQLQNIDTLLHCLEINLI